LALKSVVVAFEGLTRSIGNSSWIEEWEKLEKKAAERRGEAMMIYNVSLVQGMYYSITEIKLAFDLFSILIAVSQAEKRDELLAKTPAKASEQVHWIWAGMILELEQ